MSSFQNFNEGDSYYRTDIQLLNIGKEFGGNHFSLLLN